ncbi:phage baseplate assembly protein V [Streptomyces sp. NPDC050504]|uniref:phage baseplate assembly protein V n=1 Tax=Streptomyces sp. NPDC050504 TaxID=3365618 RepID=UPI0037B663EB
MSLERVVAGLVEDGARRYGKYRGRVVDNADPKRLGRLKLTVPDVFGPDVVTGWASPCVPYGGAKGRGLFFVPENGSGAWVEFEQGDTDCPLWVGTYWCAPGDESQVPRTVDAEGADGDAVQSPPTAKLLRTGAGHVIQLEDARGRESLILREGARGHRIVLDQDGITVTDARGNTVALRGDGIRLTDATGNALELTDAAVTLTAKRDLTIDAAGHKVTVVAAAIDLKKG